MINPQSLSENLLYTTTRLVGVDEHGNEFKSGTGFFFSISVGKDRSILMLVTNKHVVDKSHSMRMVIHTSGAGDCPDGLQIIDLPGSATNDWIGHQDEGIDLCALVVSSLFNITPRPFFRTIGQELILSEDMLEKLFAIEDVLMVGYPNGLWDEKNNYPLFRRGITASHPAVDFNGKPISVLDIAAFPGSSGSPVFIYNPGVYSSKDGSAYVGGRIIFLGVLFEGPTINTDGKIDIRSIPTGMTAVPVVSQMMNLGHIVKAREVCNLAKYVQQRCGF